MGHKNCFVCDNEDLQGGIFLTVEKTLFTDTEFPSKICQLIGDRFLVIVDPLDQLCINCTLLINKCDKLETKLLEIKDRITQYLSSKYKLDEDCSITEDFELINEDSDHRSPSVIDIDSYDDRLCSDITSNGEVVDKNNCNDDHSSCDSLNKNLFNVKEEPLHFTWPEECLDSDNRHECLDLASSPCLDESVSDSITCGQTAVIQRAMSGKMEVQNITEGRLREIKKELYINVTESSPLNLPSEGTGLNKSTELYCDTSASPSMESSALHINNTNDKNLSQANSLLVITKRENNVQYCDNIGSKINVDVSDLNPPKTEKSKRARRKRNREFNGYQQNKLRPILPKISKVVHSYCVVDLDEHDSTQPSEASHVADESGSLAPRPVPTILSEPCPSTSEPARTDTSDVFQCKVCSLQFGNLPSLKAHRKAHARGVSAHECGVCKRVYKTRSGLQNHQAKHTGRYTFYCEVCGAGFMTRWGLTEHGGSHTNDGRYTCHLCDKRFAYQSSFWIHKKWHENPTPYTCDECGLPFRHSSQLANHRRSRHSGQRPYRCSFCPMTFAYSTSLRRHEILHTKKFPYSCAECRLGFTTRFKYSEHLATVHGVALERAAADGRDFKVAVVRADQQALEQSQGPLTDAGLLSSSADSSDNIVTIVLSSPPVQSDSLVVSNEWFLLNQ